MALVIEFYVGEVKLHAVRAPSDSVPEALSVAREGLVYYKARYARVVDMAQAGKVVGIVHRDVLP